MKKHWNNLKRVAVIVGLVYGLWVGAHNGCTDQDVFSGFAIIVLSLIVGFSLWEGQMIDKKE